MSHNNEQQYKKRHRHVPENSYRFRKDVGKTQQEMGITRILVNS